MKVLLLAHTPDPEKLVAAAAKVCYSAANADQLFSGLDAEKTAAFLEKLVSLGHESPLEHVSFTFAVEGISRACLAQLTRHRIASYSVQSQRYVRASDFEFVVPPEIAKDEKATFEFLAAMREDALCYENLTRRLTKKYTQELVDGGMDEPAAEKAAEKRALEDARFVLPNAACTKLVCTFNARSLLNFFLHRCCTRAQWEIRELAAEMLRLVKQKAPVLFKMAGPSCLRGQCPEGAMSCGRSFEMKREFAKIKATGALL